MKVHFIAVGGTGMGALAVLMAQAGHEVRGSDEGVYPPMSTQLARAGIPIFDGFSPSNLDWAPDCVVVGNVCRSDHPEVLEAQARKIKLESFPSLLSHTLLRERRPLVVAGTHGKTTTASLLTWCLVRCQQEPSWLIGGVPQNLQRGSQLGSGAAIVLEGDEYDTAFFDKGSKFLHYRPHRAILTSVEWDHADIFDSLQAVRDAFAAFIAKIPASGSLVVHRADPEAMALARAAQCEVVTYEVEGEGETGTDAPDYTCRVSSKSSARRTVFEIFERGQSLGEFTTSLIGRYNLGNILAAVALARLEGCSEDGLRDAIRRFRGVKRRQELVGVAQGVRIVDDFAHHPTAVELTIAATRRRFPENALHVCFEPRTASSRRNVFLEGYGKAFKGATHVYIGPLHAPEKVPEELRMDTKALVAAIRQPGTSAKAFDSSEAIAQRVLDRAVAGDTVLVLSSGAFGGLIDRILDGFGDAVVRAVPEDIPEINELMSSYGLTEIADDDDIDSLVIRDEHGLVGCVHLEMVGQSAHFFGLSVRRGRRGEGLGWALADRILRRARTLGARLVYLISGDTADFFAGKFGFAVVKDTDLGSEIAQGRSFRAVLDSKRERDEVAVCMVCDLSETPPV